MSAITTTYKKSCKSSVSQVLVTALILLISAVGQQTVKAQEMQRITVEPDNFPAQVGKLNGVIEENGGDVIYVLRNGGTYFLDRNLGYDHPLYIEAEEYPSDNPPIIRPGTDILGNSRDTGEYLNSTYFSGIFFYSIDDLGGKVRMNRMHSEEVRHIYRYCYFMAGANYTFHNFGAMNTVRIEDSQSANHGRHTSPGNSRFFDTRGNSIDSLIIVNTSIYQVGNVFYTTQSEINYLYLDHVTVTNDGFGGLGGAWPSLSLGLAREATIKNSLFQNRSLMGAWESEELVGDNGPKYTGDRYVYSRGYVSVISYEDIIDPEIATDADRTIIIKNNNFGGLPDQEYLDMWERFSEVDPNRPVNGRGGRPWITDPQWRWDNPDVSSNDPLWATRDTIKVVRVNEPILDSTLTAWIAQGAEWILSDNNIEENVIFNDPPESIREWIEAEWYGETLPFHYDYGEDLKESPNTRFFHPGPGSPTNTLGPTAAWFRDLGYNEDAQSFTHAENNYPLGNLNYFPELREKWEQGEVIPTSADLEQVASGFHLIGNYPNPFNPTTTIVFEIGTTADVNLEFFNVLGQKVQIMHLGSKEAGEYRVTFDASNMSSGLYMVRMQVGTHTQSHVMTLIK
jgi:hypothetical protein